ncbi:hypothetical protein [Bacillus cereus]|uniref:hypothetical protein n=1 Tax=Bacillus cereus TaxID=1396 RepID=UPI0015D4E8A1|nr:hypothetical protein [Bacillus cereus]
MKRTAEFTTGLIGGIFITSIILLTLLFSALLFFIPAILQVVSGAISFKKLKNTR